MQKFETHETQSFRNISILNSTIKTGNTVYDKTSTRLHRHIKVQQIIQTYQSGQRRN